MDCLSRSFGFLFDVFHLGGDLESPLASVAVAPIRTLSPFDVFSHQFPCTAAGAAFPHLTREHFV